MTELQKTSAPSAGQVEALLKNYLPGVKEAVRVPEGVSTYVYRVWADCGVCYARFLPEDATFGVEVLTHRLLLEKGVPVPEVLLYLPEEPVTGHSLMVVSQIPGASLAADCPIERLLPILREAGEKLALLHSIPVQGFGWIDRNSENALRGEHPTFSQYFEEFLEEDLSALSQHGLPPEALAKARRLLEKAKRLLDTEQAVLVHGDFCLDHIFQENGAFTGFIDFGEIRGCYPFFDLGTFALSDPTSHREATEALLEGYGRIHPLGPSGRLAVELSVLAFALRFAGKKAGSPNGSFWMEAFLKQLERIPLEALYEQSENLERA